MHLLASIVRLVVSVAALLLVAGIAIHLLDVRVALVTDAARWLARPFRGVLTPHDKDLRLVLTWGLAAVVYSVAGALVCGLLERGTRVGPLGRRV